jgi:hypothetical protein
MPYTPNPAGLADLAVQLSPAQQKIADQVASLANANSPTRDFTFTLLRTDQDGEGVIVTVGTTWPFAHLIEWGSVNNPPYAPLRKAVTGLGLRFVEE